jgi:carboxyl-terminal processing protease
MPDHWRAPLRITWFVAGIAVVACQGVEPPRSAGESSRFAAPEAQNMFKAVYGIVSERYIDTVSAEHVALAVLAGLTTVDPALNVAKMRDAVELGASGRRVLSSPTPTSRDVNGWALTSVQIWRAARAQSPLLAAAPQESVYEAMFDRATAALDGNSRYATPAEARQNRQRRDGYYGIGISVRMEPDGPTITEVTGRSPAERAGLRVGDVLVQIDGRPVSGLSEADVDFLLREEVSGRMKMTVRRLGRSTLRFVVPRSYLIPDMVKERYEDGILFLTVLHFNQDTADDITRTLDELFRLEAGQLSGVVLDLRGNPGGLLQQAVKVADLFLADGAILATRGRHPDSIQDYFAGGDDVARGLPLVVLIDGSTASAAELTAAALQDRGRAIVIGSTSYGKGTVQTVVPLPNGGEIGLTWSYAVSPTGVSLRAGGIRPLLCSVGLYAVDPDALDKFLANASSSRADAGSLGCPAERRDGPVDIELARRLLHQPSLFAGIPKTESLMAQVPQEPVP